MSLADRIRLVAIGCAIVVVSLSACRQEKPNEKPTDGVTATGAVPFVCTGTECTCHPSSNDASIFTCKGMQKHCNDNGKTMTCTYPPREIATCTCEATPN